MAFKKWRSPLLGEFEKGVKINIRVGILKQDEGFSIHDRDDGPGMAQVAFWNEYGKGVPKRPALSASAKKIGEKIEDLVTQELNKAYEVGTFKNTGHIIGSIFASENKKQIKGWVIPPNAEETVAKKGFNNPLVERGDYYRRQSYSINGGRSYKLGDES